MTLNRDNNMFGIINGRAFVLIAALCALHIHAENRMCLRCDNLPHPRDCDRVVKCSEGDSCYVEQIVTESGNIVFNSGCASQQKCKTFVGGKREILYSRNVNEQLESVSDLGTRNQTSVDENSENEIDVDEHSEDVITTCFKCCNSSNYCNRNLCDPDPVDIPANQTFCLNCPVVEDPSQCEFLVLCNPHEICFTEFVNLNGEERYRMGCVSPDACSKMPVPTVQTPTMVGKKRLLMEDVNMMKYCSKCCSDAVGNCNRELCPKNGTVPSSIDVSELTNPPERKDLCTDLLPDACKLYVTQYPENCKNPGYANYACRETCGVCVNTGHVTPKPTVMTTDSLSNSTSVIPASVTSEVPPQATTYRTPDTFSTATTPEASVTFTPIATITETSVTFTPTDGGWGIWEEWSVCKTPCGEQSRLRQCNDPAPANGGRPCPGNGVEYLKCSSEICPVAGGWATWTGWSSCSVSCGIGLESRDRDCTNPFPKYGGDQCYGNPNEDRICFSRACSDGGWFAWSSWSSCSASCNGGLMSRRRFCDNPKPSLLGRKCPGNSVEYSTCNLNACTVPQLNTKKIFFSVTTPTGQLYENHSPLFSNIIINQGNNYDTSTGRFTATVPGVYQFFVTFVTRSHMTQCFIRKNNGILVYALTSPSTDWKSASASTYVHCVTGDVIDISCGGWENVAHNASSMFSGALVSAD